MLFRSICGNVLAHIRMILYPDNLHHWIAAEVAAATVEAKRSTPDGIELLDKWFDKCRVVAENAVFEVALLLARPLATASRLSRYAPSGNPTPSARAHLSRPSRHR